VPAHLRRSGNHFNLGLDYAFLDLLQHGLTISERKAQLLWTNSGLIALHFHDLLKIQCLAMTPTSLGFLPLIVGSHWSIGYSHLAMRTKIGEFLLPLQVLAQNPFSGRYCLEEPRIAACFLNGEGSGAHHLRQPHIAAFLGSLGLRKILVF
jgi:hypothetical protein